MVERTAFHAIELFSVAAARYDVLDVARLLVSLRRPSLFVARGQKISP